MNGNRNNEFIENEIMLERNGVDLHLECIRTADFVTGRNILLVHGVTYSSHEFDINYRDYSLARFLAGNGYAVWLLDISGYGKSGDVSNGFMPDSRYASEDIFFAVSKILELTDEKCMDILGWSWGTVTTGIFAAEHPELINRLILYAPIATGIGAAQVDSPFHENTWEDAAGDFQKTDDGKIDPSITDPIVAHLFCSLCWKYDGAVSPNGGRRDICVSTSSHLIDFSLIQNRTLVICGNRDPYLNIDVIKSEFGNLKEGSVLKIIDGAAHAAYLEKPFYKEFQNSLIHFLVG